MWSHELDPTDLQNVNNLNFSGSNRKKKLRREMSKKKTMKGQLRAKSERWRKVQSEMRRGAGKQLKARMIITAQILWSLVIRDADDRTSERVFLIRRAIWTGQPSFNLRLCFVCDNLIQFPFSLQRWKIEERKQDKHKQEKKGHALPVTHRDHTIYLFFTLLISAASCKQC